MGSIKTILAASAAATILVSRFPFGFGALPTFLALTALLSIARFVYLVLLWPFVFSPLRNLPGPKSSSWFTGEFGKIMALPGGEPHKEYLKIPNNGMIRYLHLWNKERIMPTTARVIQQVLSIEPDIWTKPPQDTTRISIFFGLRSILFTEGEEHRVQRRILTPAFSRRQIRNLVPVFWEKAMIMGNKVAENVEKGELVDICRWSSLATLDIIGAAGLGYEFDAMEQGQDANELAAAFATFLSKSPTASKLRFLSFFIPFWILYRLPLKRSNELRAAGLSYNKVCRELIATKRRELAEKKAAGKDNDEERDILSVLIKSGEYETEEGTDVIRDQLMTFLAAGHETTATLLMWAVHLLIEHPKWQKILRDEIRSAFPHGSPESITFEQLEGLKNLQNFATEAIRYFPPVPLLMRMNNRDTTLDGVFVPKGTHLAIVPWALHKDPKIWGEDADEFRPERWEGDQPMDSNYNLLTFLAGPRNCIGKDFAKSEFKALVAVLVGRFHFEGTGQKIEIQGGITSRPKELKVIVKEVGGW